jgi:hypothetical protein
MPPKAKAESDVPVVRRPRSAVSDDPAVEKRREQNRQAQAKNREKQKALKAGAQTSLGKSSLASIAEGSPAKAKIITNKPISQAVKEKMSEEEAKNIISRAMSVYKAEDALNLLRYKKKMKEIQKKAQDWLKTQQVEIENEKLAYVYIQISTKSFKTYIGESYPQYLQKIEDYQHKNVDYQDKVKGDEYTLYLKYRPYQDYDYFVFSYRRKDGSITDKEMKISYTADVRFSTYLQNQYWRYTYYKVEERYGRFTAYSSFPEYEGFRWEEGKKSVYEKYPALEFDDLEANTDKIKEVDENNKLVKRKYLKDEYEFYQAEDWWFEKQDEQFDRENRTIYFDKKGNMIANLPTYDKDGNEIERNIVDKKAQSASANLGRSSTGASTGASTGNTNAPFSSQSSITKFVKKLEKNFNKKYNKKDKAQTAPVQGGASSSSVASSSVASSSVASSSVASSSVASSSNDSDYASNWSSTNASLSGSVFSSSRQTNNSSVF